VSESTLEAPPIRKPASLPPESPTAAEPWTLRKFVREHPWWTTAVVLVLISTALVLWAGTRPSYDAYGWLVWGYQTLHLTLDLGGAPSWKPLPYLFTVPFALAGHYELRLWMIAVVAVSLAGCVFAGRIAYRLIGRGTERRYPAIVGAVFAGAAVLGLEDYMHYILSAQTDPMIVTFCLAALDCYLGGRRRWAFWLLALASLGRPEVWLFFGAYSVWLWWRFPSMRTMVAAGLVFVPFMWFGIPWITNHRPLVSAQLALGSPRELRQNRVTGTIGRFTELEYLPVWLAALVGCALALVRRDRVVLWLAGACVAWVIIEIAFALHGWPALPRYMFEAAAVAAVIGGVAVGWVLTDPGALWRAVPRWAGVPVVVVLMASLVPAAFARVRSEHTDLRHERARTHEIALLQTTLGVLGGYQHIRNCGEPVTNVEYVSTLAWFEHLDVGFVGHRPEFELHQTYPIVLFTPVNKGWLVLPWHTRANQLGRCLPLHSEFVTTRRHPNGALLRR